MKFTLSWLLDYLDTNASLEEILTLLTAIGLEVEDVVDRSKELAPFTIAQIIECSPHPDADKLRVCKVKINTKDTLQVVCGAPNAREGIFVVFAPEGSIIPTNGMKIKAASIRGVSSNGMLCSAKELDVGEDEAGIIELAEDAPVGSSYADYAGLTDPMIEIAITPNRGDCLGVYGIARDLAAAGLGTLKTYKAPKIKETGTSAVTISIEDTTKCPLFIGRTISGVTNGQSPAWLQQRLQAIKLKPISALVDITNYISFSFGRPLHVYDCAKLKGDLKVRSAKEGETIEALNEKTYNLTPDMTVVADQQAPQAIAGIIGGEASGCTPETSEVFLEVALFDPIDVARTGRALQVDTDSRYRFERNVDPAFLQDATAIATQMILDLCGGKASKCVIVGSEPDWKRSIDFDFQKVQQLAGINVDSKTSKTILKSLGFDVSGSNVTPPSWRADVEGQADLVEEITRIYGYDNIPATPLPAFTHHPSLTKSQRNITSARRNLANRGLDELVTWSFTNESQATLFGGDIEPELKLLNPIHSELNVMRPSLYPNLFMALKKNNDRGFFDLGFFEIGPEFSGTSLEKQRQTACVVRSGLNTERNMHMAQRPVDFLDSKADAFAILEACGMNPKQVKLDDLTPNWYHPGRSASIQLGKNVIGYFGELHPSIIQHYGLKHSVVGCEIFFNAIPVPNKKEQYTRSPFVVSDLQPVHRDFAFIVDRSIPVNSIQQAVLQAHKSLINQVSIFDIYEGKNIADNKKSVAFSVTIQPATQTLTDKEIEDLSAKIIQNVTHKTGGELRTEASN